MVGLSAVCDEILADPVPTALLFGPEDMGLSNDDLGLCHSILTLPTAEHASLNLAQAVTVTCSHLLQAELTGHPAESALPSEPAPAWLQDAVVNEGVEILTAAGYLRGRSAVQIHGTLYRLFGRARPSKDEAEILRGMAKQLQWWFTARAE